MSKARNVPTEKRDSDGFPKTVKSGAASVTVYRRKGGSKGDSESAGARSGYTQFTVYYVLSGKEYRLYRNNEKKAMALAREKALEIERGHVTSLTLVGAELEAYVSAKKLLESEGLSIEAAIRDYTAAYSLVRPMSLIQLARQHRMQAARVVTPKTIEEMIPEFLASKAPVKTGRNGTPDSQENKGQSDKPKESRHYQTLKNDLARFAGAFSGRLLDVNAPDIDKWLQDLRVTGRNGKVKEGAPLIGERTRRNIYGSLSNLFHWAQRKCYLPRERPTEIDYVEKPGKPPHVPRSFNAEETQKLLDAVPGRLVPLIVLCAFAGVRRCEVERLDWEDIRWKHDDIQIWADAAKTSTRRLPPLLPIAKLWLKPFQSMAGPICPSPDRFNQLTEKARSLELEWSHDVLRDSFISNRAAVLKDLPAVAYEAGNSQRVIKESYLRRVSEKEAKEYFAVKPKPGWKPAGI